MTGVVAVLPPQDHEDLGKGVDPAGVEAACPALNAMHGITLFKQQLRKAAVLPGDSG